MCVGVIGGLAASAVYSSRFGSSTAACKKLLFSSPGQNCVPPPPTRMLQRNSPSPAAHPALTVCEPLSITTARPASSGPYSLRGGRANDAPAGRGVHSRGCVSRTPRPQPLQLPADRGAVARGCLQATCQGHGLRGLRGLSGCGSAARRAARCCAHLAAAARTRAASPRPPC